MHWMPTMTNAYASTHGRSLASMLDVSVTGTVDRLRASWTKYATYRKTLASFGTCRPAPGATWISTAVTWRQSPAARSTATDEDETARRPRRRPAAETEPKRTLTMAHAINLNAYADYAEQPGSSPVRELADHRTTRRPMIAQCAQRPRAADIGCRG
jgi:hypothetical protein